MRPLICPWLATLALLSCLSAAAQTPPAAPAPAAAAATSRADAEHAALRQLKDGIAQAISRKDFDALGQHMAPSFRVTLITQDSFSDVAALKGFYDSLFTRPLLRLQGVAVQPEADELSQIYTGTFAITRGHTQDRYDMADGRSFDLRTRWTATSIRQEDGSWKLLAVHSGVNFLDNPVLAAIEKSVMWTGAAGAGAGLLLGFALGWLLKRRPAPRA